jgi:cell division protein ZapA
MEQIDVKILDREYRLAVNTDDKPQLLEAVKLVDDRMRIIREGGRVTGLERIAVMAALQLAHELVTTKANGGGGSTGQGQDMLKRLQRMNAELDQELKRQESLF